MSDSVRSRRAGIGLRLCSARAEVDVHLSSIAESSLSTRVLVAFVASVGAVALWESLGPDVVARTDDVTVASKSPFVAPGDTLWLDVGYRGGTRAAIERVIVHGPGFTTIADGTPPKWGPVIDVKRGEVGSASERIAVRLPARLAPSSTIRLALEVQTFEADVRNDGKFENVRGVHEIELDWRLRTAACARAMRGLAGGLGALWLAFATLFAARAEWRRAPVGNSPRRSGGRVTPTILAGVAYALGAGVLFRGAMECAFAVSGFATDVALVTAGSVLPLLVGRRIAGPRPKEPLAGEIVFAPPAQGGYRQAARGVTVPASSDLADGLRSRGRRVRVDGPFVTIEAGGSLVRGPQSFVELKAPVTARTRSIGLRFNDTELLLEVALSLVPRVGPFELVLVRTTTHRYAIDATTRAVDVVEAFRAAQRDDIALAEARADLIGLLGARRDAR